MINVRGAAAVANVYGQTRRVVRGRLRTRGHVPSVYGPIRSFVRGTRLV